ncbi:DUF1345 domain-containing protein [Pseudohalocynthiibacter aestuariivivens]|uniref:DUF1345 domain-containing protein n=1 Tax=Roseovarius pelagicus TaxID=2980108 RepID=A0ABY6D9C5_9RHOB|nr:MULTISPECIES: DUF1345 domain-containing protein [Rhodobacterales]QIE45602.1 DUF1345 domain-containing protein [Pseudohalocynthiibacter aestuariivivens]UXX82479.1 DUF1345 domain-containing protein [Roseovarius pelagicus]
MKKIRNLRIFKRDEDGAVTVDWVVLTAAVVGLAAGGVAEMMGASSKLSGDIKNEVSGVSVSGVNR